MLFGLRPLGPSGRWRRLVERGKLPRPREVDDLLHALDCLFQIGPRGAIGHPQPVRKSSLKQAVDALFETR